MSNVIEFNEFQAFYFEMYEIFDKRLARCSEKYPGTALDNQDIWKCTGANFDE